MLNSRLSYKRDDSELNCPRPSSSTSHLLIFHFIMCICKGLNASTYLHGFIERRVYESTERSGQRTTFLLLWPTAFRILPFKARPHSVSLYPHVSLIPLGSLGAPESPFISCHQPVMRSHLQEISKQVPFLRP